MLPGTQRLAVSSLSVSGRPSGRAATSGQVMFRVISGHRLSPASAPHFLSTTCDSIDSGPTAWPPPALALMLGRP